MPDREKLAFVFLLMFVSSNFPSNLNVVYLSCFLVVEILFVEPHGNKFLSVFVILKLKNALNRFESLTIRLFLLSQTL